MELADGTYDVIVVAADDRGDGVMAIDAAIASGVHRGDVVSLLATNLAASEIDLLAAPATLVVEAGHPRLTLDR
ncbi:MAG: hypothetical protein ACYDH6_13470 [Acidimicrobiales bacterium]